MTPSRPDQSKGCEKKSASKSCSERITDDKHKQDSRRSPNSTSDKDSSADKPNQPSQSFKRKSKSIIEAKQSSKSTKTSGPEQKSQPAISSIKPSSPSLDSSLEQSSTPSSSTASVPSLVKSSGVDSNVSSSGIASEADNAKKQATVTTPQVSDDFRLLLTPMFSAMTKITDNLFLTGVGGMTKENFRKNHIDFVVNITTEAPFWEGLESMRLPLDDDPSVNIAPYFDIAVDRIHEAITKRDAHVLVHCVAGVSRSAAIVIAYLMKHRRMDLKSAFNLCYNLRPVIRPNNGFMVQLISYESRLFGKTSVRMVDADVDGVKIEIPDFFVDEHPRLVLLEVFRNRKKAEPQQKPQSQQAPNQGTQQRKQTSAKQITKKQTSARKSKGQ